jgi:hypothetical protein
LDRRDLALERLRRAKDREHDMTVPPAAAAMTRPAALRSESEARVLEEHVLGPELDDAERR